MPDVFWLMELISLNISIHTIINKCLWSLRYAYCVDIFYCKTSKNVSYRTFGHILLVKECFQEPVLYSGTIRYNILYGCEQWANDSHMIDAAKLANAHDFISELDHGYDTKCGEKGVQMSG